MIKPFFQANCEKIGFQSTNQIQRQILRQKFHEIFFLVSFFDFTTSADIFFLIKMAIYLIFNKNRFQKSWS